MLSGEPTVGVGGTGGLVTGAGDPGDMTGGDRLGTEGGADPAGGRGSGRQSLADLDAAYLAALSGFKGRIIGPSSEPVPDCDVRFFRIDPEILQNPGLFLQDELELKMEISETRTEEDGRFLVTGVWPKALYMFEADSEGDNRLSMPVERTPGTGEIVDLGDIQLVPLGVILGQVVDEAGTGVGGAMIRAADIPGEFLMFAPVERFDPEGAVFVRAGVKLVVEMPGFVKRYFDMLSKPMTYTAPDGFFRLGSVQPGMNVLVVNNAGFQPLVKNGIKVESGKERSVGALRLREGEEVFVKVVDSDDKPVAGAEVLMAATTSLFPADFASRVGVTDARGEIYEAGFPKGSVTTAARQDRSHPWVLHDPENIAADIVIKLPGRHHLDLKIISSVGQDIENPEFKLLPAPENGMPLDVGAIGVIKWLDVDDKITLLEDGIYRVDDLIPGKYTIAVAADHHAGAKVDFEIIKSAESQITLRPESPFEVQVLNSFGESVPLAKIYVETSRPSGGQKLMEMPISAGTTDRDGRLTVSDGEAGRTKVSASHPAYGFAHKEFELPTAETVVLQMDDPGQLVGRLTEGGRPPLPGKWTIVIEARSRGNRGAMPALPSFTVPDLEGDFLVQGMNPGRYRLQVISSISALTSPGGMVGFMMQQQLLRQGTSKGVEIKAGEATIVQLEAIREPDTITGPSARVSGTVLVNGLPAEGFIVSARGRRQRGVKVGEAGEFDLGRVRVGQLNLRVTDPAGMDMLDMGMESHLWAQRIPVEEGKNLFLDIHVYTGGISGTVLTTAGLPAVGVRVKATGRAVRGDDGPVQTSTAFAPTDNMGNFNMEGITAGTYRLEVDAEKRGVGVVPQVQVRPGDLVAGILMNLLDVKRVSGMVDYSAFGDPPPEWVHLQLVPTQRGPGARNKSAMVRRNGRFAVSDVPPGEYRVTLTPGGNTRQSGARPTRGARGGRRGGGGGGSNEWVADNILVGDLDVKGLELQPRPKAPPPPPPVKKTDDKKDGKDKKDGIK